MGGEFGQTREWNHDFSLDWHLSQYPPHRGLQRLVADLNRLYGEEASLHELDAAPEGFSWIDCNDHDNSVVSFLRRARNPNNFTVVVLNFTPVPRHVYRVGVPMAGRYRELLNTDAAAYGGSNTGNAGLATTDEIPAHGYAHSLRLTIPPLACVVLKPESA
jgi:1,4-alpha-glucan branching enzyme